MLSNAVTVIDPGMPGSASLPGASLVSDASLPAVASTAMLGLPPQAAIEIQASSLPTLVIAGS